MTTVSDTPYTAIRAVRTAGSPLAQLSAMLAAARRYGGPGAARAAADKAAVPTAVTGALRTPSGSYVPLVWLRPDQAYGAPYALERKCAVLPEGATALPEGWSVAL